jgi:hypothetical protein
MNPELIKQAYAYGAAVALQELGFNAQQAQAGGVKLASAKMAEGEEEGGMHPALAALLGGGAGALGGAALGAGSAFIPGLRGTGAANLLMKSPKADAALGKLLSTNRMGRGLRNMEFNDKITRFGSPIEAALRGTGGAGLGALGGGLAGGLMAGE